MTPKKYAANLTAHKTCTYTISPCATHGVKETVHYNGKSYSETEFNEAFPINSLRVRTENLFKGLNPDRTKAWAE